MNKLLTFLITWFKKWDEGSIESYPDPYPPADLGQPLTQEEIDFVKKLKAEMDRFSPTSTPGA